MAKRITKKIATEISELINTLSVYSGFVDNVCGNESGDDALRWMKKHNEAADTLMNEFGIFVVKYNIYE